MSPGDAAKSTVNGRLRETRGLVSAPEVSLQVQVGAADDARGR